MTRAKQSAIPLIAPSQLQPRLYQNIQNLDVLLIGSLEMSNVSNALIGLQSQGAHDRDAGGLKVTKIKSKQSTKSTRQVRFRFLEANWNYQMSLRTEDLDKAIAEVIGTFGGLEEMSAGLREGILNYIQRKDILAVLPAGYGKSLLL